jgi:DNA-binding SARP family transcriptional activator/predicted ATPase
LGPLQATLDGQLVSGFKSNKVRALLAYLAVEADRPHGRDVLAGLLWPDWPDREALGNLRYALSNLRRVIADAQADPCFLLISRQSLQFNTASDSWLDVAAFTEKVEVEGSQASALEQIEEAVGLYQGPFLEGFSVGDSVAFEEWALFKREQLARQLTAALHRLVRGYEEQGDYQQAQSHAWRQVELEPWDEVAHRALMRTLALGGKRSGALAQYETCRRLLAEELDVEPSEETTGLYEQIRDGELKTAVPSVVPAPTVVAEPPAFLDEELVDEERPVFVAREQELAQLHGFLELALAGQGRVAFITGEAGSGKTTLVQEFAQRAQDLDLDLVAASGNCNAYTGIGDPYLPFREILELLTGDVQARWEAGAMSGEHARRLWHSLPVATQALVEVGLDLVDTFVPRAALLQRAMASAPEGTDWLARLEALVQRKLADSGALRPQQSDLFEQYTKVLQALARRGPLLLVVDDLQWADLGSTSLLFHLGRQLAGSRILIVGAYRPEEVAIGRDGERHPLEPVLNEFQRDFGDMTVDLRRAERWDFVEALLDSEPNRVGRPFREMLYRQTNGHPLFTIELLRGLEERGDVVQDSEGKWIEGPTLDWETLPARVEAVIAERVGRLDRSLLAVLRIASVEGEVFTAEVVAHVQAADEREVVRRLSSELDRRHRLVRAQAIERLGAQRLSRYRFRNYLFQKYLYDNLDEVERVYLHEDVGNALERLHGDQATETATVAVQLARHFQEAGIAEKAIHYLHQAGERAVQLSAYREGIAHLTRGLELLMDQPDYGDTDRRLERAQQELALQFSLGLAWVGHTGYGPEVRKAYYRARELGQRLGETSQLCRALGETSIYHYVRAEYEQARELAEEALSLAQRTKDPLLLALSQAYFGFVLFALGEFRTAHAHFEQVITFYRPAQHHRAFVSLRGSDLGLSCLAQDACCLWCFGYPDQAAQRSREALALAREMDHPFSLADALAFAGCLFNHLLRDVGAFSDYAREFKQLASERLPGWLGSATWYWGEALALQGHFEQGIGEMRKGMEYKESAAESCHQTSCLCTLAESQAKTGHLKDGLSTLSKTLARVEGTGERYAEAEVYRVRAELLLMQGSEAEAEASLHKALQIARRQDARSWELRTTTSLARLWQKQGKMDEARQALAEIYGWFTEGFDTPDLQEAKTLLQELS